MLPIFYITIGSGIGGGRFIVGQIYRGVGRGAAEIGDVQVTTTGAGWEAELASLESVASGWGIAENARRHLAYSDEWHTPLREVRAQEITAVRVANEALAG